MGFWRSACRIAAGIVAWLLLLTGVRLARVGLGLDRAGIHATWMFRLAAAALDAATWLRPDLTR
jgi:hypothetical protein